MAMLVENPPHAKAMVMAQVKMVDESESLIDELFQLQGEDV